MKGSMRLKLYMWSLKMPSRCPFVYIRSTWTISKYDHQRAKFLFCSDRCPTNICRHSAIALDCVSSRRASSFPSLQWSLSLSYNSGFWSLQNSMNCGIRILHMACHVILCILNPVLYDPPDKTFSALPGPMTPARTHMSLSPESDIWSPMHPMNCLIYEDHQQV